MKKISLALSLAALIIPMSASAATATAQKAAQPATTSAATTSKAASKCTDVLKAKVNLNKASEADLDCLKGVGPVTAKDIIKNRPFKDENDFAKKIEGTGKKIYDTNKSSIVF